MLSNSTLITIIIPINYCINIWDKIYEKTMKTTCGPQIQIIASLILK